ncbi:MAG: hypothetical protein RSB42_01610 [Comamonas sp.]
MCGIGLGVEQTAHYAQVASGECQCRPLRRIGGVHIRSKRYQCVHARLIAQQGGMRQRSRAHGVASIDVRPGLHQQFADVDVTMVHRMCERGLALRVGRIDPGLERQQLPDRGDLVVDGCRRQRAGTAMHGIEFSALAQEIIEVMNKSSGGSLDESVVELCLDLAVRLFHCDSSPIAIVFFSIAIDYLLGEAGCRCVDAQRMATVG